MILGYEANIGLIYYGPKWSWAEMVMGRNGHGPKRLWAEMTRNPGNLSLRDHIAGPNFLHIILVLNIKLGVHISG